MNIINENDRQRRMKELMPDWKVAAINGDSGDEIYGEMDPNSGMHSKGDTEVEYPKEGEEDIGEFIQ